MAIAITERVKSKAFIEGWRAGCATGVSMDDQAPDMKMSDVPYKMRLNPYDGRTRKGKDWKSGFAAALDAYQGQFQSISNCWTMEFR